VCLSSRNRNEKIREEVIRRIFKSNAQEVTGDRENCAVRSFIIDALHQIKEVQLSRICSTHGGDEK
jgi:hypothetical protein